MSEQHNPDKLMWFSSDIKETDAVFHDVRRAPFDLYGLYNAETEPQFKRIPDELSTVSDGVAYLYRNTAGGRIRFATDSPYIILRATMPKVHKFNHMTMIGVAGFDLYEDNPDTKSSRFVHAFKTPVNMTEGYEDIYRTSGDGRLRHYTINFPLYNDVNEVYLGLKEGSTISAGLSYDGEAPIVFYGSSITQGGCASRPGNSYEAMICRRLNRDHLNMGFSGSAKGEPALAEYFAKLPMSLFVCDYDYNAPTVEHLEATHYPFYEIIRAKNPDLPYLMVSRHTAHRSLNADRRREVIRASYDRARATGDENVYFLDGDSFFPDEWRDACTVDTCHPNDLGFYFMACAIGDVIADILKKND